LIQYEKVEAARLDLTKYDFTRVTDIAKARAAQKVLPLFLSPLSSLLFSDLFSPLH